MTENFIEKYFASISKQILEGLIYIHSTLGICHRDIKPDNILVQRRTDFAGKVVYRVKICDFNVAKKNRGDKIMMTKTGLDQWQAPEMEGRSKYTEKVDLWSAGCVFYFMLTGYCPFSTSNSARMIN